MERRDGRLIVPCGLCGIQTPMTGTKRCDPCWQLERCVEARPVQARQLTGATTLVEQRDRLTRMLANVIDANYGTSYHHIGDGDGMPEDQAREIQEWWQAYLEQIRAEYTKRPSPSTAGDEQGGGYK